MYIAEGTFTALKAPSKELDKKHWVEFKAPQGEKGQPGTPGTNGKDGRDGHDGTGLTLKTFVKDHTYHHGDYVFAPSSKDPTHDSMYIAEGTFIALKIPSNELDKKALGGIQSTGR